MSKTQCTPCTWQKRKNNLLWRRDTISLFNIGRGFVSKSFLVSVYESCSWFPTINPQNDPRLNHFLRSKPQAINRTLLPFLWKILFINNMEHIYTYMNTHPHTHAHLYTDPSPLTVRIQSGERGCAFSLPDLQYNGRIVNLERKESEAERDHFYQCLRSTLKLLDRFIARLVLQVLHI